MFTVVQRRVMEPWTSTLKVVRPSGAGFRRLASPSANVGWQLSVSPGGTKVLYTRGGRIPEWRMVDVTGRHHRLVRTPPAPSRFRYPCTPQWTPDGKRLAARLIEELAPGAEVSPIVSALVTFGLSARDERKAFPFPSAGVGTYGSTGCAFSWQRAG